MPLANLPTHTVEIAFATDPGATPTWTDISAYVRRAKTNRGRQHELEKVDAGAAELVLDNRDRRFDPTNTASPYYPNVLPMRRVRIRATRDAVTHDIFHGYIDEWPQSYPDPKADAIVTIRATDAFKVLALRKVSASFSQALSGARVTAVLDNIGWPAADRDVAAGISTVQAATLSKDAALSHLQDVCDTTELGELSVSRDGKITFRDRHARIKATADYATHTWGDEGSEFRYQDIVVSFDDADIWNEILATRSGGIQKSASDSSSQTKYLQRTLDRSGLLFTSDTDSQDYADFLKERYREPATRIRSITIDGSGDTTQWAHLLHHDLGDKILVRRRPPGGGAVLEQKSFIEGIEWTMTPAVWLLTWRLSPVDRQLDYWVLGDSEQSLLGTTTRLAF